MTSSTTLPNANSNVTPFTVRISDDSLEQLKALLRITPITSETYESSLPDGDRKFGIRHDWFLKAIEEWGDTFDWRKHEGHINTFDHFHMNIDDKLGNFHTHFVAMFPKKKDAIPLMLLHGWPGSFLEFLPTLDKLRKRYLADDLPYHLIVPSLPGYAFSSPPPVDKDIEIEDVARVMDQLMLKLGFGDGYMVQGGDVGSNVLPQFYTPGVNGNPHNMAKYKIPASKPFGYSYYPHELYPVPRSWAATTGNLSFFRAHEKGGHFAAVEQTEAFLKDHEEFVQESRGAAGFDDSE
ncbi:alpha/beta-hydrolase [Aureobasidium pullulans]|nr:alpha/beta-hydrolase [Aureobasidium pullulans]